MFAKAHTSHDTELERATYSCALMWSLCFQADIAVCGVVNEACHVSWWKLARQSIQPLCQNQPRGTAYFGGYTACASPPVFIKPRAHKQFDTTTFDGFSSVCFHGSVKYGGFRDPFG
jgi:hypothetical protein